MLAVVPGLGAGSGSGLPPAIPSTTPSTTASATGIEAHHQFDRLGPLLSEEEGLLEKLRRGGV
ncbi:MAG: hypothetical protein ACMG6S_06290 [Byssovorax sp.]